MASSGGAASQAMHTQMLQEWALVLYPAKNVAGKDQGNRHEKCDLPNSMKRQRGELLRRDEFPLSQLPVFLCCVTHEVVYSDEDTSKSSRQNGDQQQDPAFAGLSP